MAYGEPDWASPGATTPEATQNAATGSNISANNGAGGVRYVYFLLQNGTQKCCVECEHSLREHLARVKMESCLFNGIQNLIMPFSLSDFIYI